MSRRHLIAMLLGVVAVSGLVAGGAGARAKAPARMLIYAQEYSLWPSRTSLPPGTVIVQLWNRGEDAHDVRIRHLNADGEMVGATQGVKTTLPGAVNQATWHLAKGRYELYCSMPGHLQLGMHTNITVR